MNLRILALSTLLSSIVLPYAASQTATPNVAASALTAVPPLVPYSGRAEGRTGQSSVTFLVFKDQQGGEPLFTESQIVSFDETGRYKVQLGAANSNGLPSGLFSSGEARWLEVQVAGRQPEPRILLASVPYALKAADAATLGGLPASAFALADGKTTPGNGAGGVEIVPNASSTVTTTGGTANKVVKFSGTNTIVNSTLYDNGTQVGVGTTTPNATLAVNGTFNVNGVSTFQNYQVLAPTGTATANTPHNSQGIKLYASAYNSSSKSVVTPHFQWQAEPTGNNTSAPSGTLNLLATSASSGSTETGFYFNTDGTIHFAPNQTFQGNTTIEGITTTSYGVLGYSTGNTGVLGISSSVAGQEAAVSGASVASSGAGIGVLGDEGNPSSTFGSCRSLPGGAGVWGDSNFPLSYSFTPGVLGTADDQTAGFFANNSSGASTLFAVNNVVSQTAPVAYLQGTYGSCTVDSSGSLMCTGSKSAVVPVDHNSRKVALYAVESPENWFEDFGSGKLSNGTATVNLERVFAQTVNLDADYHVFLTPNGESNGLYISRKTPTSFEVHESNNGHSSVGFDYRIVARRKGYENVRLADKTKEQERPRGIPLAMADRSKKTR